MLASHTSIRHLFSKCLSQYEKLRKKQAFLDNYRKFPMFVSWPLKHPAFVLVHVWCTLTLTIQWWNHENNLCQYGQDNDLSEFDESRDIIESLVDEYKACESPDYIKWGMEVRRKSQTTKLFPINSNTYGGNRNDNCIYIRTLSSWWQVKAMLQELWILSWRSKSNEKKKNPE